MILLLPILICIFVMFPSHSDAQVMRTVFVEEFTGAWCGWCPYGADTLDMILGMYPVARALSYHYHATGGYTDTLYTPEGNSFMSGMNPAFPQAAIDRVKFPGESKIPISRERWRTRTGERNAITSPVYITANGTFHQPSRLMTVNIHVEAYANVTGTYNLNVVLAEDDINYRQYLYYLAGGSTWLDPYYHKHVVRKMITGASGKTFTTSGFADLSTRDTTITFTIPSWWDYSKLTLSAFLAKMNGSAYDAVLQGFQEKLTSIFSLTPVQLLGFGASAHERGIRLHWRTGTETNNHGWEIERSKDTRQWNAIGFVAGSGTTNETRAYEFIDENVSPNVRCFYRLKQRDLDGRIEYSPIATITGTEQPTQVTCEQNYPNPFGTASLSGNPNTVITYSLPAEDHTTILITDNLGRRVKTLTAEVQPAGIRDVMWDGTNEHGVRVAAGVYNYTITTSRARVTKQMMLLQ